MASRTFIIHHNLINWALAKLCGCDHWTLCRRYIHISSNDHLRPVIGQIWDRQHRNARGTSCIRSRLCSLVRCDCVSHAGRSPGSEAVTLSGVHGGSGDDRKKDPDLRLRVHTGLVITHRPIEAGIRGLPRVETGRESIVTCR